MEVQINGVEKETQARARQAWIGEGRQAGRQAAGSKKKVEGGEKGVFYPSRLSILQGLW